MKTEGGYIFIVSELLILKLIVDFRLKFFYNKRCLKEITNSIPPSNLFGLQAV
jgi:hypothetical protein